MKIGVDIRPLQETKKSGVGELTYELLAALFRIDRENEYFLFSNTRHGLLPQIPPAGEARVTHIHKRFSNKILNFRFRFFHAPKIDRLIGEKLDAFIFPNINFYALSPGIDKYLIIHDLSFEIFPDFFSNKGRLWHKMVHTKNFCREADRIVAVSKNTKNDLIHLYNIPPEKISVIYPCISERLKIPADSNLKKTVKDKYRLPEKFILYLGNIEARKNIVGLVQTCKALRQKGIIDHELIVGGASPFAENKKFFKEHGTRKRKHNEPTITPVDMLEHCHYMIDKIEEFVVQKRIQKACRWLGFVQGCLWTLRYYSIEELRKHNSA